MKKRVLCVMLAAAMTVSLFAGCGSSSQEETTENVQQDAEQQEADEGETSVAGTYHFTEVVNYGDATFETPWDLTLNEDGSYELISDAMMSVDISGTYEVQADGTVLTGAPVESDFTILADFFEEDYSCYWILNDDQTCTPVNYSGATEGVEGEGTQTSGAYATAVAYASNSSAQVCDIYFPEGDGPYPVVVVFHGGGFMFGAQDMEIIQPIISACVANGYAVVSADYRKSSEATFPAAVADAKAVVRFVKESASEYGFDADKIAVWGESAGAYLALMTALTPSVESLDGDVTDHDSVDSSVNALVTFYAPVEFATMKEEYESWGDTASGGGNFESQFLGVDDIYSAPDACAAAYWETYKDELPSDFALQAWIEVGDENDTNVPYTQSVNFADRLSGVIGESNVTFVQLPGAAHEDDAFYTDGNLADVIAFLDGILK
jgi:acetyl esterase/lipase